MSQICNRFRALIAFWGAGLVGAGCLGPEEPVRAPAAEVAGTALMNAERADVFGRDPVYLLPRHSLGWTEPAGVFMGTGPMPQQASPPASPQGGFTLVLDGGSRLPSPGSASGNWVVGKVLRGHVTRGGRRLVGEARILISGVAVPSPNQWVSARLAQVLWLLGDARRLFGIGLCPATGSSRGRLGRVVELRILEGLANPDSGLVGAGGCLLSWKDGAVQHGGIRVAHLECERMQRSVLAQVVGAGESQALPEPCSLPDPAS